jgi:Iap family predicted aminopeptidase
LVESYRELDKRMLGEVYGSTNTMENLVKLCDEYKSRWPGSGDDRDACVFMVEKLEDYGFEDPRIESFICPGWIRGSSKLSVFDPMVKDIPCIALPMSCEGEIEAELVFLGDGPIDIYEKRREEIDGNIVMVTSRSPLTMNRSMHRMEKFQRSVLAGAKGWIFMNHYPAYGPPTGGVSPIIPAVGISYEDGSYLSRILKSKGKIKLKLETKCKNRNVETYNVVSDIPGSKEDTDVVIYGAHYEGHDIAVGALDNATGAVCVLEVARVLLKERKHLKRPMKFILFGAEEIGLYGSWAYVDQNLDDVDNIRFMLNFDAAGRAGKQGFNLHGWTNLEPLFSSIADDIGVDIPLWQSVSPYSDHWPFLLKGIPTATMGDPEENRRRGGRGFGHTIYDTVDKADLRAQRECVANSAIAAIRLVNSDNWPVQHRKDEDIDKLIRVQGYDEIIALGERLKKYLFSRENNLRNETKTYLKRLTGGWRELI